MDAAQALVATNPITGTGGLTKMGPGYLMLLNTNNTYSGGTVVSNGTLRLAPGAVNPLATNGALVVAGGTLDLNGYSPTLGGLSSDTSGTRLVTSGVAGSIFNRSKPALLARIYFVISFHSDSSSNARIGSPLKSTSGLAGMNNNCTRS